MTTPQPPSPTPDMDEIKKLYDAIIEAQEQFARETLAYRALIRQQRRQMIEEHIIVLGIILGFAVVVIFITLYT